MASIEEFKAEIIKQLDELDGDDPESAHANADQLIVMALGVIGGKDGREVVAALDRLRARANGWWFA